MTSAARQNWPGMLSIALAAAAVASYFAAGSGPDYTYLGKLGPVFLDLFQLCTTLSLVVGIAALMRARRGSGGLVTAVAGLLLGGTLSFMWAAWIALVMLSPGGLGE